LDHVGAIVAEHLRAHWAHHHLSEVDDADAGERQVGRGRGVACVHAASICKPTASAGTSGLAPAWSPGSAPCSRSLACNRFTSTWRAVTPACSAIAAATPAASPIAMHGGISRDIFCADDVAE